MRNGLIHLLSATAVLAGVVCVAQQVHVTQAKDHVELSIAAQQPFQLMVGQPKLPVLTVECAQKGKKAGHLVLFQPGTALAEDSDTAGLQVLTLIIDDHPPVETNWMPYGDSATFAYYGKTEAERLTFVQLLENSKSLAIEFKPFLTGMAVTSHFALDNLRDEVGKHPQCAATTTK
jgi:hypothetical protein